MSPLFTSKTFMGLTLITLLFACQAPSGTPNSVSDQQSPAASSLHQDQSSSNAPASANPVSSPPALSTCGAPLSPDQFAQRSRDFAPATPHVGNKWVYATEGSLDFTIEVVAVTASKIRIRDSVSLPGIPAQEKEVDTLGFEPYSSSGQNSGLSQGNTLSFCQQSDETIAVPAGNFQATRFSFTAQSTGTLSSGSIWLSKDTGIVKIESSVTASGAAVKTVTVLKEKF